MLHRFLTLGALVIIALAACMRVDADGIESQAGSANTSVDNGQVTVGAGYAPKPGSGSSTGGDGTVCWYEWITGDAASILGASSPASGGWVLPHCTDAEGNVLATNLIWMSPAQIGALRNVSAIGQQAVSRLPLPTGFIRMAPASTTMQVVGARTWLWLDPSFWHSYSATATAGPVSATATAVPSRVDWSMGDGHTVSCAGPGTPYDPSKDDASQNTSCAYTWTRTSTGQPDDAYKVTATVFWNVTWTAQGAAGGGSLGVVPGPTSSTSVQVGEAQAVNAGGGG